MGCTHITWKQTVRMVESIVSRYGAVAGNEPSQRGFPSAEVLAAAKPIDLRNACKLGYRAEYVLELARRIREGDLDLGHFESDGRPSDALYAELRGIKGVGDYAAGCLLMLLGHYDRLAVDSEMVRHYRTRYPRRKTSPENIRRHYRVFQPFAFLAYWYDLWTEHVDQIGPPEKWTRVDAEHLTERSASA